MKRHKPLSCFALIAVKYTRTEKQHREEEFIYRTHPEHNPHGGRPRKGLKNMRRTEAGTEAGGIDRCCITACSLWIT